MADRRVRRWTKMVLHDAAGASDLVVPLGANRFPVEKLSVDAILSARPVDPFHGRVGPWPVAQCSGFRPARNYRHAPGLAPKDRDRRRFRSLAPN